MVGHMSLNRFVNSDEIIVHEKVVVCTAYITKTHSYTQQSFPGVSDVSRCVVPLSIRSGGQWMIVHW